MEIITSTQNAKVKQLALLQQKSAERRRTGRFVVEGRQELRHCLSAGYAVETVFVCPAMGGSSEGIPAGVRCVEVSAAVYEKLAYRESTEGLLAEVRQRRLGLEELQLSAAPLLVVLESVEKPGNLGAVLRSADASGVDAVIVCDPLTDLYNPNLIRASVGAAFSVPTVACTSEACIRFLRERHIQILTAQLQDSRLYYDTDMTRATAIVMGTEHDGLTTQWRQAADRHIRIPMLGQIDSLNVSVSAAVLMFEAVRQRQQKV